MKKVLESMLRKSISEEQEAISLYLDRVVSINEYIKYEENSNLVEKLRVVGYTLEDIIKEEKIHVGQLTEMLTLLDISLDNENLGREEAQESIKELL